MKPGEKDDRPYSSILSNPARNSQSKGGTAKKSNAAYANVQHSRKSIRITLSINVGILRLHSNILPRVDFHRFHLPALQGRVINSTRGFQV